MAVHFPPDSLPRFHLLLLGMGPDGHTCSLFPGHRTCDETSVWVAPITNAPKPPPSRITLTFPVVNNAECCVFAVSGAAKADMIKVCHHLTGISICLLGRWIPKFQGHILPQFPLTVASWPTYCQRTHFCLYLNWYVRDCTMLWQWLLVWTCPM